MTRSEANSEDRWTAEKVHEFLSARFSDRKRYAYFREVASGTGFGAQWVDAVVLNLWPSDGLLRSAFEIKVSRHDFLRELNKPAKNDWARQFCHYFWFVAPAGVVKSIDEIPDGCGWMEAQRGRVIVKKQARRSDAQIGDDFVASLARSTGKESNARSQAIVKEFKKSAEYRDLEKVLRVVNEFLELRVGAGRGTILTSDPPDVILDKLEQTASTTEAEARMKLLAFKADQLRRSIATLAEQFLVLGYKSIEELRWFSDQSEEAIRDRAARRHRNLNLERRARMEGLMEQAAREVNEE